MLIEINERARAVGVESKIEKIKNLGVTVATSESHLISAVPAFEFAVI